MSIRKKILAFVVLPFLLIYGTLSGVILRHLYQIQIRQVARRLHNQAVYNEVNLKNFYSVLELSVQISASELEKLDPANATAREMGEHILTTRFRNSQVINAWLAFEPGAFDGRDERHTGDYPGAPSGRYIRSFIRSGNLWKPSPDIDEAALNDPARASWYVSPRDTGAVYSDVGRGFVEDYGAGPVSVMRVSAPVYRDGRIIGCVGMAAALNEKVLGDPIYPDTEFALFLPGGRIGYSPNTELAGKSLEDLGLDGSAQIREAMGNRASLYLDDEYLGISGKPSYSHFHPVGLGGQTLYLYTAFSRNLVWANMAPSIQPIGISLLVSMVIFSFLILYLSRTISEPLKKLTQVSEELALGRLDVRFDITRSRDELGMITRSLGRMAEQFRASKLLQGRYQDRFDIVLGIHYALFRVDTLDAAFDSLVTTVAEYFSVFRASLVFVLDKRPRLAAVFPQDPRRGEKGVEFLHHDQVAAMLSGKKHLTMNYGALHPAALSFVDYRTRSLCILPLRTGELLRGYLILEGREPEAFIHDDTTALFMGDILAYVLAARVDWIAKEIKGTKEPGEPGAGANGRDAAPARSGAASAMIPGTAAAPGGPEGQTGTLLEKAKTIRGLDVDKGVLLIGGEKEKYAELLRVTSRIIIDSVQKMRSFHRENLPAFAIEVHGMKAALYSIGAESLGGEARQLEFAAKSDDLRYCQENYPVFEENLRTFSRNLAGLFPRQERTQKGDTAELLKILPRIRNACAGFDADTAASLLAPALTLQWEDREIGELLEKIEKDLENIEYDGAGEKIAALRAKLGDTV
ncbi:MAG: HAMP domain-containing protein [Treponema sp.]|jgi:HAMP domain-containing protein|nr:HAMP domain-containing protein [Treponema sp.]